MLVDITTEALQELKSFIDQRLPRRVPHGKHVFLVHFLHQEDVFVCDV